MTTINNTPIKKVFKIDISNITREQAMKSLKELMQSYTDINPRWLIEYERKTINKSRKEKIMKLNGSSSTL